MGHLHHGQLPRTMRPHTILPGQPCSLPVSPGCDLEYKPSLLQSLIGEEKLNSLTARLTTETPTSPADIFFADYKPDPIATLFHNSKDQSSHGKSASAPEFVILCEELSGDCARTTSKIQCLTWDSDVAPEELSQLRRDISVAVGHDMRTLRVDRMRSGAQYRGPRLENSLVYGRGTPVGAKSALLCLGGPRDVHFTANLEKMTDLSLTLPTAQSYSVSMRHGDACVLTQSLSHLWRHSVPRRRSTGVQGNVFLTFSSLR